MNESRKISKTKADQKEKKTSHMYENIIENATSIEVSKLNLIQRSDETKELSNRVKAKKDYGNQLKLTSKINQDERTRMPEIREQSATIIVTDNKKLLCSGQKLPSSKKDSQTITTSKEISKATQDKRTSMTDLKEKSEIMIVNANYNLASNSQTTICMQEEMNPKSKETTKKQCIQQIDEINNLRFQLNNETGSGTKQKITSMENQEDINRSNKKRQSPENRAIKKKCTISCLNEACTTIKTSK